MPSRYLLIMVGITASFFSCLPPQTGNTYSSYYGNSDKKYNFVKSSHIKDGEKLVDQFPDEDFYINDYQMVVYFERNADYDEWKSKQSDKKKPYKTLRWTYYRRNLSVELNDDFTDSEIKKIKEKYQEQISNYYATPDIEDIVNEVKLERNAIPPGEFVSRVNHSYELISLQDLQSEKLHMFFTSANKIENLTADYGKGEFNPESYTIPYESDGYFHTDQMLFYSSVFFPTVGSKATITYENNFSDMKYNSTVYVPEEYIAKKKTITFAIPAYLEIELVEKNFEGIKFKKTNSAPKQKKKSKSSTPDLSSSGSKKSITKKSNEKVKKEPKTAFNYITYEFENVPKFGRTKGSRGISYNFPHFLILYKNKVDGAKKTPLTGTINGLYGWYRSLIKQLENDSIELKKFTKKLIENKNSEEEKIKTIYYWVQDNIRYIAFEDGIAGFKPAECAHVFEKRYGDCKGMANLLVNMLKIAGFDSRRVWIGTRHLNYDYTTPSMAVDNHMIAAVKLDTGFVYLDGTENYCPYKEYAHRIQGRPVLIENGDSFLIKQVPEKNADFNKKTVTAKLELQDNKLVGKVSEQYNGESRLNLIRSIHFLQTENRDRALYSYLSNKNVSIIPSEIKTSSIDNREGVATIDYNLELVEHVIKKENTFYINFDWEKPLENYNIDTIRNADVDFHQKMYSDYKFEINLGPSKISYLPKAVLLDNEFYKIDVSVVVKNNIATYKNIIILKQGYLPKNKIKEWNESIKKLKAFYNDYIIITK